MSEGFGLGSRTAAIFALIAAMVGGEVSAAPAPSLNFTSVPSEGGSSYFSEAGSGFSFSLSAPSAEGGEGAAAAPTGDAGGAPTMAPE